MLFKKNENHNSINTKTKHEQTGTAGKTRMGGLLASQTAHLYETSVGRRAMKRAGKNPNLKGHINEIVTCDRYNANPTNILKGRKARLTNSPTAVRDDIVVMQNNRVVKRMQLKDTPKGIGKTIRQVENGHYKGTNLMGTKETTQIYAKKTSGNLSATQKMTSNHVSSGSNERIAKKMVGGGLRQSGKEIIKGGGKAGMAGAVLSGGVEMVKGVNRVRKGEDNMKNVMKSTAKESAIGGSAAFAGKVTADVTTIVVAATPAAPIAPVAGFAAGTAASIGTDKACRWAENRINQKKGEATS